MSKYLLAIVAIALFSNLPLQEAEAAVQGQHRGEIIAPERLQQHLCAQAVGHWLSALPEIVDINEDEIKLIVEQRMKENMGDVSTDEATEPSSADAKPATTFRKEADRLWEGVVEACPGHLERVRNNLLQTMVANGFLQQEMPQRLEKAKQQQREAAAKAGTSGSPR